MQTNTHYIFCDKLSMWAEPSCGSGKYNRLGLAHITLRSRAPAVDGAPGTGLIPVKAQVVTKAKALLPAPGVWCRPRLLSLSRVCDSVQGRLIQGCLRKSKLRVAETSPPR